MENSYQLVSLGRAADCVAQGVDGSIFLAHSGNLYIRRPEEKDFELLTHIDDDNGGMLLAFDNIGNLYYSGSGTGRLWISSDYGKTFSLCLEDVGKGTFRNLIQANDGTLYVASYALTGPATLYESKNNGRRWTSLAVFRCRHIHTIAINPFNDWIYVVCGEAKAPHIADGNCIFRSKDKGQTFYPIVKPKILENGRRRPLYLSINFMKQKVILGTDHFEGDNGIDIFIDDGKDIQYSPKRTFTCPYISFAEGKGAGYYRYIIYINNYFYAVCAGENVSIGSRSIDGENWEDIFEVNDCVGFMVENNPYANAIYLSGRKSAYALKFNKETKQNPDSTYEEWQAFLRAFDSRYTDVCKGYYLNSLKYTDVITSTLDILQRHNIPQDGFIADVGCGVGSMLLIARQKGYRNLCGIEANPRWIIAARRLQEAYFPAGDTPVFKLVPRGDFSLPIAFGHPYHAILILGVFVGNGNKVPLEKALKTSYDNLQEGGIICFNIHLETYGESSPDFCFKYLEDCGFKNISYHKLNTGFMFSACK